MNQEPIERRESVPLTAGDVRVVDRLTDPTSLERYALDLLSHGETTTVTSKASLLRAAFRIGIDPISDKAGELGYQQLAESMTADETAEDATITRTRRQPRHVDGGDE